MKMAFPKFRRKGDNAGKHHFQLFSQCLLAFLQRRLKILATFSLNASYWYNRGKYSSDNGYILEILYEINKYNVSCYAKRVFNALKKKYQPNSLALSRNF